MNGVQEIAIHEFYRRFSDGVYTYALYNGRCVRRKYGRGRPHYEVIGGLQLSDSDRMKKRSVNVNSQLGRILLSKV